MGFSDTSVLLFRKEQVAGIGAAQGDHRPCDAVSHRVTPRALVQRGDGGAGEKAQLHQPSAVGAVGEKGVDHRLLAKGELIEGEGHMTAVLSHDFPSSIRRGRRRGEKMPGEGPFLLTRKLWCFMILTENVMGD